MSSRPSGRHLHYRRRVQPRALPALHQSCRSLRCRVRLGGGPCLRPQPSGRCRRHPLTNRIELLVSDRAQLFEEWLPVWHFAERVRSVAPAVGLCALLSLRRVALRERLAIWFRDRARQPRPGRARSRARLARCGFRSRQLDEHCASSFACRRSTRHAPGASPPRPSFCRRSPFPIGPRRWPNQPPRRSRPSHTPRRLRRSPTPATGSTEGRSFPKRPAFPFAASETGKEKATGTPSPFPPMAERGSSWPWRGTSRWQGAAGLAGVSESGCQRRHVTRTRLQPRACRKPLRRSCWPPRSPPCRSIPPAAALSRRL